MEITNVKCTKYNGAVKNLLAFVDVTIDDCLVIHNIRIVTRVDGTRFLSFPSERRVDPENAEHTYFSDLVHPINRETRKLFEDAVFAEFDRSE